MSREELVRGYTAGRLSRRAFVKGLAALGVSAAAAVAYANALATQPAPRAYAGVGDLYDHYQEPSEPGSDGSEPGLAPGAVEANPKFAG